MITDMAPLSPAAVHRLLLLGAAVAVAVAVALLTVARSQEVSYHGS